MEKIKKCLKSQWTVYLIFSLVLIILNFLAVKSGDDLWFQEEISNKGVIEYLSGRYNTWTSRLIIETTLVTFANAKVSIVFFQIANILIFNLLLYSISKLFVNKENKYLNWFIMFGIFALPPTIFNDTGTIATAVNYLWVLAFGLFSLIPIKKSINNEEINLFERILYLIALIYAANQEQMAAVLLASYTCYIGYLLIKKEIKTKLNKWDILSYIIIIASFIFILTCPGNTARKIQETATWFPAFENFGIFSKVQLGITSMMKYLIIDGRIIFALFTFVLSDKILKKYNNLIIKIIGIIPFIGSIIFSFFYSNLLAIIPNIKNIVDLYSAKDIVINATNYMKLSSYIMLVIYILVLGAIFIDLYLIFRKDIKALIAELIYMLGLATRMVMGFSPTVFASSERTSLFLYVSFIILIVFIMNEKKEKNNNLELSYFVISSLGILENFVNLKV